VGSWTAIRANYSFFTPLGMFFPGAGAPTQFSSSAGVGQFALAGYSYQLIQF
jgi:hypothetical protein